MTLLNTQMDFNQQYCPQVSIKLNKSLDFVGTHAALGQPLDIKYNTLQ